MNKKADNTAKAYSKDEILINAPIEDVYHTLANINDWPEWQNDVTSAEIKGEPETGKSFVWNANGMKIKSVLHTVNPYSEFGWTGKMLWISAVHNWKFITESYGTRVLVEESLKGFGSKFIKRSLTDGMKKNLAELKREVENN